jgi:iron-sulfur cluster assembly protein
LAQTTKAAERIKEMIEGKDDVVGVRISVRRRGCNGYSYTMNYAKKEDVDSKKDEAVSSNGITVLVDPKATLYIVGTVMDFEVRVKNNLTLTYFML